MRKLLLFFALVLSAVALRAATPTTATWTFNDATLSSSKTDNRYTGSLTQTTTTDGTWSVAISTNSKQKDGSNGVRIGANGNTFKQGDYIELSETKNPIPATAKITSVTFDVKGNAKGSALSMDLYLGGTKVGTTQSFSGSNSATKFKWENLSYTGNIVKFIIAADASYGSHLKTISITYEEDGGGDDPQLGTYDPKFDNVSLTVGDTQTITAPSQDGKDAPAVTYSSDNACVTISGSTLTAVSAGTANISASWEADDNWKDGVIENAFTVTVTAADEPGPQPSAGTYKLVKSTDDLKPGAKYIIAWNDVTNKVQKSMSNAIQSSYRETCDVTITAETLTPAENSLILTLEGNNTDGWKVKTTNYKETDGYMNFADGGTSQSISATSSTTYTVSFVGEIPLFLIKGTTNSNPRSFGYNSGANPVRFAAYQKSSTPATSQYFKNVKLYKEVTDSKEDYKPIFADLTIEKGESAQITMTSDNSTEDKAAPEVKYAVTEGADFVTIEGTTVTAVAKGASTVTASWDANDDWNAGTATFDVTVTEHIDPQLVWVYYKSEAEPRVEFTTRSIDVKDDASRARTSVICKASPETQLAGITYSSSDENVAMIDENSGEIVLMAGGKTTIKAHFAGDDTYKADDAEYTLTVTVTPDMVWEMDKTVKVGTQRDLKDIFTMDNEEALLPLVQFTSTDPEVAEVTGGKLVTKKAGYVTVTATLPRGAHEMYTGTEESVSFMVTDPGAGDFTFDFTTENPYGTTTQTSGTANYYGTDALTVDMGNIELEISGKARHFKSVSGEESANNLWLYSADATYKAGQLTFSCPQNDYEITSITFHRANVAAAEWNFACDDETIGQIADNKEGNTILSKTWTPAEDTYQQIVMFTATGNARFSAIDVTVAPLPAAAEPEMSMSATSVTFKAKHPSHELYVVAFKGVYNPAKSAANRAAAAVLDEQPDLDGTANWTKAEGISHTHEFSNAAEGEIYSVLAKSIDKKGNESPVVWRLYDDSGDITGIEDIAADNAADNVEYYNVQGMRLSVAPATGIYFERRGNTVTKRAAR